MPETPLVIPNATTATPDPTTSQSGAMLKTVSITEILQGSLGKTTTNPGEIKVIDGVEYWVEPDGYQVEMKFVRRYPGLFGPLAIDPDHGNGEIECDDAIARIMAKLTGYGGTYSTWSERHCSIVALSIAHDISSSADVPPCPKFWLEETQYWVGHIAIGREVDKNKDAQSAIATLQTFSGLLQNKAILARVLAISGTALAAGYALLPQILKLIGINI
jgi:hypothetical protein